MQGVLARFKEQNASLRACLKELEPAGVVNTAIWNALDNFDSDLAAPTLLYIAVDLFERLCYF